MNLILLALFILLFILIIKFISNAFKAVLIFILVMIVLGAIGGILISADYKQYESDKKIFYLEDGKIITASQKVDLEKANDYFKKSEFDRMLFGNDRAIVFDADSLREDNRSLDNFQNVTVFYLLSEYLDETIVAYPETAMFRIVKLLR
ncbi:MAG: hypothetical protein NDI94_06125 [Candidatus Woesearchaeota archaeon]|nr:hypothetical protein [Candidatus Woesearchaeota archaeon]